MSQDKVEWMAKVAEAVAVGDGVVEKIHTAPPQSSRLGAMAVAQALACQLGDAVVWVAVGRVVSDVQE